jgi:hypothetical protein
MTEEIVDLSGSLGPVRDQGNRGTCLAFATTAGHESTRLSDLGGPRTDLSEELLYWACKQVDGNALPGRRPHLRRARLPIPGNPMPCSGRMTHCATKPARSIVRRQQRSSRWLCIGRDSRISPSPWTRSQEARARRTRGRARHRAMGCVLRRGRRGSRVWGPKTRGAVCGVAC